MGGKRGGLGHRSSGRGNLLVIVGTIGFVTSLIFWSSWGGFGSRDGGQNTTIVERDPTADRLVRSQTRTLLLRAV